MYLLDTNACIQFLNGTSNKIKENFQQHSPAEIALCSVVKAELLFGARHSQKIKNSFLYLLIAYLLMTAVRKNMPKFEPI